MRRWWCELQQGAAHHAVQPAVTENDAIIGDLRRQIPAPGLPLSAADLEDIRVVGLEVPGQRRLHRLQPIVLDLQLLITGALPEELLHRQVERAEREPRLTVAPQVRVGEGHGELVVLVPDIRAEEERPAPFQLQEQAGEIARPLVVQTFLAQSARLDIAVVVEDREGVAVLEHAGPLISQAGGGQDVIRAPPGLRLWRRVVGNGTVMPRRRSAVIAHCLRPCVVVLKKCGDYV